MIEKYILFLLFYFLHAIVFAQFHLQALYDNPTCQGVPYYAKIEQGTCKSSGCSPHQGFSVNCSSTNYFGYTAFNKIAVVYPFTPIRYLALVAYNDRACRTLNTLASLEYFQLDRCLAFVSHSKRISSTATHAIISTFANRNCSDEPNKNSILLLDQCSADTLITPFSNINSKINSFSYFLRSYYLKNKCNGDPKMGYISSTPCQTNNCIEVANIPSQCSIYTATLDRNASSIPSSQHLYVAIYNYKDGLCFIPDTTLPAEYYQLNQCLSADGEVKTSYYVTIHHSAVIIKSYSSSDCSGFPIQRIVNINNCSKLQLNRFMDASYSFAVLSSTTISNQFLFTYPK